MAPKHHTRAEVVCEDCPFSTTVRDGDDRLPADVVREHGEETGHKLSVTFPKTNAPGSIDVESEDD